MGWLDGWGGNQYDSGGLYSNYFSGNSGGSNFDWNSLWGDTGSTSGWSSYFGDSGDSGSSSSSGWLSKLFGGSSGSSSSVNWGQALLSGLGGAAEGYMNKATTKEAAEETGKQQRKTVAFTADLEDYYKQEGKRRKRVALDTYGMYARPGIPGSPGVTVPTKPNPGGY